VNRLTSATSPYLLQHADNPVDWYPWGAEALAKAKAENKVIFLSIGYAACHWCHVMAHESFEDPTTAAVMNTYFINIKVDREERPDLDGIYMQAVVALTGHGGWPMSVFLTPEGVPFYGGTYFPPRPARGMPSFRQVLEGAHEAWVNRRAQVLAGGQEVLQHIQHNALLPVGRDDLSRETLQLAIKGLWNSFDARYHGWGSAPKFPQPMTIEFLLRYHTLTSESLPLDMAIKTLHSMARGGMYDQLGGGFHRYATDAVWLVPHFEKMLYDNAQLARVYLHAWQLTGEPEFRRIAEETLDYVLRELTHPRGGFYSSQDADSEGREGKFFVWTEAEIDAALGAESALFKAAFGARPGGNFEGRTILHRAAELTALAAAHHQPSEHLRARLETAKLKLFARREHRIKPGLDDKILAAWNGLMLAAFAEAARVLERADYRAAAIKNADFLLETMRDERGRVFRAWRDAGAEASAPALAGYLEDYACLAEGLLALYETTYDSGYFVAARALMDVALEHFADPGGGFFDTADDHETLVTRPKDVQDNATPSGNALAATVLLKLAAFTGETRYAAAADQMLKAAQPLLARYPTGFAQWLSAAAWALSESREIAVIGDPADTATQTLLRVLHAPYRPFQVTALAAPNAQSTEAQRLPLLAERPQRDGRVTAYVCRHFACQWPVTTPAALEQQLQ
jgi:hypothetical protein